MTRLQCRNPEAKTEIRCKPLFWILSIQTWLTGIHCLWQMHKRTISLIFKLLEAALIPWPLFSQSSNLYLCHHIFFSDSDPLTSLLCKPSYLHWVHPGSASSKDPACQYRRHKRCRFHPWVRKLPWQKSWQATPVFLPGESHGQRSLVGYSSKGCKELDIIEVT